MATCEKCWNEAFIRSRTLGGTQVDHYKALLRASPDGHTEPRTWRELGIRYVPEDAGEPWDDPRWVDALFTWWLADDPPWPIPVEVLYGTQASAR